MNIPAPRIPIPLIHVPCFSPAETYMVKNTTVNNVCLKCVFHRYKITDKRRLREEGFALAQGVSKQSPQGIGA